MASWYQPGLTIFSVGVLGYPAQLIPAQTTLTGPGGVDVNR
jgi:hypothetical protein